MSPSRGLRQGDPLSPYLFVLCAQCLSSLISRNVHDQRLSGIKIARTAPSLSHLFFADDSLLFLKTNERETRVLKECLTLYEIASGQLINKEKSTITFSPHTKKANREVVKSILGCRSSSGQEIYLGLPTCLVKAKKLKFGYLVDKVRKKVMNWNHALFSEGGKEILIKSVLQAIPSYAMSCFRLPVSICSDIERIIAKFWWGDREDSRRLHWKKWQDMCKPKDECGLGFRCLTLFNKALLAKQMWRIASQPQLLISRVFKARYFRHEDVMHAGIGSNPSYIWRSLLWSREILENGARWKIGNGKDIHIFKDRWINGLKEGIVLSRIDSASMVDRFINSDGTWNESLVRNAFFSFEAEAILSTPIHVNRDQDVLVWPTTPAGQYTVASGYEFASKQLRRNANVEEVGPSAGDKHIQLYKYVWKLNIPPKIRIFGWKLLEEIIATEGNLVKHHVPIESACGCCGAHFADSIHCIFICPFAKQSWKKVDLWRFIKKRCMANCRSLMWDLFQGTTLDQFSLIIVVAWAIWKERCNWLHSSDRISRLSLLNRGFEVEWAIKYWIEFVNCKGIAMHQLSDKYSRGCHLKQNGGNILFTDAAYNIAQRFYVVGYALIGNNHSIILAGNTCIDNPGSVEAAELKAIEIGLSRCVHHNLQIAGIRSDASLAIDAISSSYSLAGYEKDIVERIKGILCKVLVWDYQHIPREKNKIAHALAQMRLDTSGPHEWSEENCPQYIKDLALDL